MHFETNKKLEQRNEYINGALKAHGEIFAKASNSQKPFINDIIVALTKEKRLINENKRWLFNFKSGGWNSANAVTKEEAIEKASKEYHDEGNTFEYGVILPNGDKATRIGTNEPTRVDPKSFRVETDSDLKACLSLFY